LDRPRLGCDMLEYAWMTMTVGADWKKVSWSIAELL
jgi:hypothetical protein